MLHVVIYSTVKKYPDIDLVYLFNWTCKFMTFVEEQRLGKELKMSRSRKDCPLCPARDLLKLTNHLADVHNMDSSKRHELLNTSSKQVGYGDMKTPKASTSSILLWQLLPWGHYRKHPL